MTQHIIIGECMVELSSRGQHLYYQTFAGDTYNTAVYLKRCNPDLSVSYWTAIGKDAISQQFANNLQEEQLDNTLVFTHPSLTLGLYMIDTDDSGERSFSYWRSNSAAKQVVSLFNQQRTTADLSTVKSVFLSGISLGILSDEDKACLLQLLLEFKQQGCMIIFDPNYRPKLWNSAEQAKLWTDKAYALADIAFPGCDDHRVLYGHNNVNEIHQHVSKLGVKEIIIKNGEHGIQIFCQGQHSIIPAHQAARVIDTTAAGDAFNGGYLAARFAGNDEQYAASFGAKVAAYVIGHKGAIVEKALMNEFIKTNLSS
jgi:2-dehydro-3-deoxygluconokinase